MITSFEGVQRYLDEEEKKPATLGHGGPEAVDIPFELKIRFPSPQKKKKNETAFAGEERGARDQPENFKKERLGDDPSGKRFPDPPRNARFPPEDIVFVTVSFSLASTPFAPLDIRVVRLAMIRDNAMPPGEAK